MDSVDFRVSENDRVPSRDVKRNLSQCDNNNKTNNNFIKWDFQELEIDGAASEIGALSLVLLYHIALLITTLTSTPSLMNPVPKDNCSLDFFGVRLLYTGRYIKRRTKKVGHELESNRLSVNSSRGTLTFVGVHFSFVSVIFSCGLDPRKAFLSNR